MHPVSHMKFRLELIEKLLAVVRGSTVVAMIAGLWIHVLVCQLVGVKAVQLKRDRCHLFVREKKRSEQRHTVYANFVCRVRLSL